jgi:EAL domain-containing protein (putative c-di-GMP-specific phosphodiesterase class I)
MDAMGYPPVHLAVNLSPIHLKRPDFLSDLFELFSRHSIAPGRIEFEITEGLLLEDSEWTAGMLTELRNAGFRLALDDFGTGFSNLGYLSRFPVDTIKIDRSFISEIHINERNRSIVRAMISLAEAMGSETVAEGVELEEEFQALADLGCHLIQGYFFSRPLKTEDLFNFLQNRSPVP